MRSNFKFQATYPVKIILFLSITLSCFSEKAVGQSSFRYPSCSLSDSTLRPGSRIRTYSIRFAFYKDSLLAGDSTYLDSVVTFFRQHPQFFVEIGVFGSSTGSSHPDTERALAIGDYLHDKGVSLDQFICGGFGIASPLYSDADISKAASKHAQDSLRALNRRVEFIILDIRPEYRKTFTLSDSTVSDGSVFRTWDISFDTVTHCHLTENSRPVLDSVADFMKKHPQVSLSVVVHDDVWSWNMLGT
ncbi:MAG TPA: hypothetical protein VFU15_09525, partial [Bacteroidia bacterium]|nr:hypothetical protein [Bacteroidia bacterium]